MSPSFVPTFRRCAVFSRWAPIILVVFLAILIDQITKVSVNHYLPLQQTIPVFEFLTLYRTFNQGIAFSILSHAGVVPIVTVRLIIVACAIWIWAHRSDKSRMGDTGYSLIIAGALGNVMDAFFYGQVVDFILLHTAGLSFAVFNAADVFISVGVSCLFFDQWFGQRGRTA